MFKLKKITFKSCSVSKKLLNFKMFKFETVRIFIIVHFRKNKKAKKKEKRSKKPVAGPFPGRPMRGAFAGALSSVPLAGGD
jgi:hypothetical protein